jgi:purine-nucleoside phosphorylase
MTDSALEAAEIIKSRSGLSMMEAAIILGRNFFSVSDFAEDPVSIPYADLPGFPNDNGELLISTIDSVSMIALKGRSNFWDCGDPSLMAGPIETMAHLGVRSILSTTFATSVNADLVPGSLVAITDHIDLRGLNPLIGSGTKEPINMNDAYDKRLLRRLKISAAAAGVSTHEGVLMWFSGPSFETPAEVRMARILGADLMGHSLVPEAILARRFSIPFAGMAVVTDFGASFLNGAPSGDYSRGPVVAGVVALKRLARAFVKTR